MWGSYSFFTRALEGSYKVSTALHDLLWYFIIFSSVNSDLYICVEIQDKEFGCIFLQSPIHHKDAQTTQDIYKPPLNCSNIYFINSFCQWLHLFDNFLCLGFPPHCSVLYWMQINFLAKPFNFLWSWDHTHSQSISQMWKSPLDTRSNLKRIRQGVLNHCFTQLCFTSGNFICPYMEVIAHILDMDTYWHEFFFFCFLVQKVKQSAQTYKHPKETSKFIFVKPLGDHMCHQKTFSRGTVVWSVLPC